MLSAREGLHEGEHFIRWDVPELDLLLLDEVTRVMVLDVDVSRSVVKYWVLRKSDTPLIVGVDHYRFSQ